MRAWFLPALLLSTGLHQAAYAGPQHPADRFAGCYQVNWGPWNPPLRDTGFVKPPDRIQLTLRSLPTPFMTGSFVVAFPLQQGRTPWAAEWKANDATSLALVWTASYGGINMNLKAQEGRLAGQAKTFWDHLQHSETAAVVAMRVSCEPQ